MDEPLSNLDAKLRFQTRAEITKLHRRLKTTTIYVTHDQTEAMSMATRIVVMKDGLIQQIGTPKEIYLKPANIFVGKFIGSPAMNFMDIDLSGNSLSIGDVTIDLPQSIKEGLFKKGYTNKKMTLGIRPENIMLAEDGQNDGETFQFTAEIEMAELMGNETLLYFTLNEETVISKLNTMDDFEAGKKIVLKVEWDKVHFFDQETELRIDIAGEQIKQETNKMETVTA